MKSLIKRIITQSGIEPSAWVNPNNGAVIDAKKKAQIGIGEGYPNFNVPLYTESQVYEIAEKVAKVWQKDATIKNTCAWASNENYYETGCGNLFVIIDGTPEENGFQFCPYCGGELK